jgi:PAS domain S-box
MFMLYGMLEDAEQQLAKEEHARVVIARINKISVLCQDVATGLSRQIEKIETDAAQNYFDSRDAIPQEFNKLKKMLRKYPGEVAQVKELEDAALRGVEVVEEYRRGVARDGKAKHAHKLMELHSVGDDVSDKFNSVMETYREKVVAGRHAQLESRNFMRKVLVGGVVLNVAIALGVTIFFMTGVIRRLRQIADNSLLFAAGRPLNPVMHGNDEISYLDSAFHRMVETVSDLRHREQAVVDNAQDVILSLHTDLIFASVNKACNQAWGYSPDDLLGRRLVQLIPENGREIVADTLERIIEDGLARQFESGFIKQDGTEIDLLWSAHWSEKEKTLFCVAHDITERKRAELVIKASAEKVRTMIAHMLVGIVILDEDGKVQEISARSEKIFDRSSDEVVGLELSELLDLESFRGAAERSSEQNSADDSDADGVTFNRAAWLANRSRALVKVLCEKSMKGPVETFGWRGRKGTGEQIPVEFSVARIPTADGEEYLVNVQDISERHAIEQMKNDFVAMVSHDLRTPLTSIRSTLDLFSADAFGEVTDTGKDRLSRAQNNVDKLIRLINDLLDLEKLKQGKMHLVLEPTDLRELVEQSCDLVRAFAERQSIELKIDVPPIEVTVDGERTMQVLVNLLGNAIKFSPADSIVSVKAIESNNQVEIRVGDQGPGIPPAKQELVFQRFKQVGDSKEERKSGSGLGLAISKAIVEAHDGEIGVESEVGKGSTFFIKFPTVNGPR